MKLTGKGAIYGTYEEFKKVGWTDADLINAGFAEKTDCQADTTNYQAEHARSIVENIVRFYREKGFVITVEQVPLQPLAMGNYEDKVSVRPVRK